MNPRQQANSLSAIRPTAASDQVATNGLRDGWLILLVANEKTRFLSCVAQYSAAFSDLEAVRAVIAEAAEAARKPAVVHKPLAVEAVYIQAGIAALLRW